MRAQPTAFQLSTAPSPTLESRRAAMLEAALDCIEIGAGILGTGGGGDSSGGLDAGGVEGSVPPSGP